MLCCLIAMPKAWSFARLRTRSRTRRSVRDSNSADGHSWTDRSGLCRSAWTNHAGGEHVAAVPGRAGHFFDIVANELGGSLGMSGVDLTKVAHEHPRINPA